MSTSPHAPTSPCRLVLVEDQTAIRGMMAAVIRQIPGFAVVGEAGDGQRALAVIGETRPDLVLLDARLDGMDGTEVLRRLRRDDAAIKVLIFSAHESPQLVRDVVRLGANGFVEKAAPLDELRKALEIVAFGGTYFSTRAGEILRETLVKPPPLEMGADLLSDREKEVLRLIATSHSTREIGEKLGISVKTADNHRTNLMRKLNLHDVASLTRFAVQQGFVTPE